MSPFNYCVNSCRQGKSTAVFNGRVSSLAQSTRGLIFVIKIDIPVILVFVIVHCKRPFGNADSRTVSYIDRIRQFRRFEAERHLVGISFKTCRNNRKLCIAIEFYVPRDGYCTVIGDFARNFSGCTVVIAFPPLG